MSPCFVMCLVVLIRASNVSVMTLDGNMFYFISAVVIRELSEVVILVKIT